MIINDRPKWEDAGDFPGKYTNQSIHGLDGSLKSRVLKTEGYFHHFRKPGRSALQRAKTNARRQFAVIGLLNDLPNFFKLLEYVFPKQFGGAPQKHKGKTLFLKLVMMGQVDPSKWIPVSGSQ